MRLGLLNARKGLPQILLPGLRLLPPRAAARLVDAMGQGEFHWNPSIRRRVEAAVVRASAHFGAGWDAPRVGRRLLGNHFRWRFRDRLLDGRADALVEPLLRAQGRDHLDSALARGKGVILLFNHFGSFLMPAHWLVRHGYPLRWLTERPRNVSRLLSSGFGDEGPLGQKALFMSRKADTAEGASSIRRALRVLKAGMVVQVAGDVRWDGPRTARARFLGHEYSFSTTWASLAAMAGAPVVPAFGWMQPDGTNEVEFAPAFVVPTEDARTDDLGRWMQLYLDLLEAKVRDHPENSGDYFFWDERTTAA